MQPSPSSTETSAGLRAAGRSAHAGGTVFTYAAPEDGGAKGAFIRTVERLSGRTRLDRVYARARAGFRPGDDPFAAAVAGLRLTVRHDPARLAAVPREGHPLVVVANHPFGLVDGLALCHLAGTARRDVRVVAMSTLRAIPEIRDRVFPINFAPTRAAAAESARARHAARAHLAAGGSLVIFPAGAVSTARSPLGPAADGPWHPFVGRLVAGAEAAVLPVRFGGQNSRLFQFASRASQTLRLALLMGEAASRIGTEIEAVVGEVIPFDDLRPLAADPQALTDRLRRVTLALGAGRSGGGAAAS